MNVTQQRNLDGYGTPVFAFGTAEPYGATKFQVETAR
jgi:hypothetical protein